MKLWTIQPIEVFNLIEETGVYHCNENYSSHLDSNGFVNAYNWLAKKMESKVGEAPTGVKYPVWAWHTRDGKRKKPDLRESGYTKRGRKMVCIELEIPDELVVLSDFDNWHCVLNEWYYGDSANEEEWEKEQEWLDSLSMEERRKEIESSWDKIFDISYVKTDWFSNGLFIQATFWELKKEYIKNFWFFTAK